MVTMVMATDTCLGAMKYLNVVDMGQQFLMHWKSFRKWPNCGLTWFDNINISPQDTL